MSAPTIREQSLDLALSLSHHYPKKSIATLEDFATPLNRLGRKYSRIQERWCNEVMSAAQTTRVERIESQIETAVKRTVHNFDPTMPVEFQGDPRGHTIKLVIDCPNCATLDHQHRTVNVPGS